MTPAQKKIASLLFTGHFLRLVRRRDKSWFVLYDQKVNPILKISTRSVQGWDRYLDPKQKLWKHSPKGMLTLNLSTVRSMHGKSTLKTLYKKRNELAVTGPVYKQKTKKQKGQNEKVHTLFGNA